MQKLKMLAVIAAFLAIPMTFGFSNSALAHESCGCDGSCECAEECDCGTACECEACEAECTCETCKADCDCGHCES